MKLAIARSLIVLFLAILACAPSAALAAAPQVQFQSAAQSLILPKLSPRCGFPVLKQVTGTYRITTFYDQAGHVSKVIITKQGPMRITLTNLNTGTSYTSNSAGAEHIIYANGTPVSDTMTGLYESINVPGAGQVFVQVGRITVDAQGTVIFEKGEHDITDFNVTGTPNGPFDPAALCAALA